MTQPNMSKDFVGPRKTFLKKTPHEKILHIANYMVQENIDLLTLVCSTRKNSDNVKYAKEVLGNVGLALTNKNRISLYDILRTYSNQINKCVSEKQQTYKVNSEKSHSKMEQQTTIVVDKEVTCNITDNTFANGQQSQEINKSWLIDVKEVSSGNATQGNKQESSVVNSSKFDVSSSADNLKIAAEEIVAGRCNPVIVKFTEQKEMQTGKVIEKKKKERPSFSKCNYYIGNFEIDSGSWQQMVNQEGKKLVTSVYPKMISEKFYDLCKGCVVQMSYVNFNSRLPNKPFTIYSYCGHSNKTSFKFELHTSHSGCVEVKVYSNVLSCLHLQKKTRELSGRHRDAVKKKLIKDKPSLVRLEMIRECDEEGVDLHNLQNVKSASVFRQAKSEVLAANDLAKDPLMDLFMMREEQKDECTRYVQYVSHPLQVILFSEDTLAVAMAGKMKSKKENVDFVVHIDATGSVARKIDQCDGKRVYYYAVVFRYGNKVMPLSEFISSRHSTPFIENWLLMLKAHIVQHTELPLFKRVVVDFAWPLIHAITHCFNRMHINIYLDACYEVICGLEVRHLPVVTLHLCVCHFVKMCIEDVKEAKRSLQKPNQKDFKDLVMQVICNIIDSTSYDRIKLISKQFLMVLLSKENGVEVDKALMELSTLCSKVPIEDLVEPDSLPGNKDPKTGKVSRHIYEKSPFYTDVHNIQMSVTGRLDKESDLSKTDNDNMTATKEEVITNRFYNPAMAEIFVKKYAPYLPMWSRLLIKSPGNQKRLSNGPIENWFGQFKNTILEGQKNMRPNRLIRKSREYVEALIKEIKLSIPTEGCARPKKKTLPGNRTVKNVPAQGTKRKITKVNSTDSGTVENTDLVEESWKRKSKGPNTYFASVYLQKNAPQPPLQIPETAVQYMQQLVMTNNVVNDPKYYVQLPNKKDYLVTSHTHKNEKWCMTISDFIILRGDDEDKWINVEHFFFVKFMILNKDKDKKTLIVRSDTSTSAIIGGKNVGDSYFVSQEVITPTTKQMFFPMNIDNSHWVLGYLNLEKNEFSYIDPAHKKETQRRMQSCLTNLNKFIAGHPQWSQHVTNTTWTVKTYEHPMQNFAVDAINCGIFVMYFIAQLMEHDHIDMDFDPFTYREFLCRELLRDSEDMVNRCITCNLPHKPRGPVVKVEESVQCTTCSRWYHIHKQGCLPNDIPKDLNTLNDKDFKVYCYLCRTYYEHHLKQILKNN